MTIYNVKKAEETYRVTKFTDDLDAESSYITTRDTCECPAGHRNTCRHREMLPEFIATDRINTPWFCDWDNKQWFYFNQETGEFLNEPPVKKRSWRRF